MITSGRRGQTCHIRKILILAESHRSDTEQRATKATSLQGQSCHCERCCGSENRKASGLGSPSSPTSSSWTWQPQLPPHQQQPHSIFPSNEIHCGQTSPPPSHWMKSQCPSVALRLLRHLWGVAGHNSAQVFLSTTNHQNIPQYLSIILHVQILPRTFLPSLLHLPEAVFF